MTMPPRRPSVLAQSVPPDAQHSAGVMQGVSRSTGEALPGDVGARKLLALR
jgi:hypothetical protein